MASGTKNVKLTFTEGSFKEEKSRVESASVRGVAREQEGEEGNESKEKTMLDLGR